jgi:hypothetical protein
MTRRELLRLLSAMASTSITACEGSAGTNSKEPIGSGGPMLVTDPDDRTPFLLDFTGYTFPGEGKLRIDDGLTIPFWASFLWTRLRSDISGFIAPRAAPVDDDVTGFVPPVFEKDALAVHVMMRGFEKSRDEVIGLYSCRVESRELQELRSHIEGMPWSFLPRPTGGSYYDATSVIRYSRGEYLIERKFMTGSWEFIDAIEPVWEGLMNVERRLRPLATLEIHAKAEPTRGDPTRYTLRVALENRGTQPVAFTDPRIPFGDDHAFVLHEPKSGTGELAASLRTKSRVMVEVSPSDDGRFWDTDAMFVPLPPLPEDALRTLVLRGGDKFDLELSWVPPAPGAYVLRARWFDYDGPIEPAKGQLPFMPIPEQGECLIGGGPYPVRGTVFTEVQFEVSSP